MIARISRRTLLKRTAAAAAATAGTFPAPYLLADPAPNSKLATAVIGAFNQGKVSVLGAATERLVALCDVDDKNLGKSLKMLDESAPDLKTSSIKTFSDYRKMYDKIHKEVDVVFVAIPDHHHAAAALGAMKLGKAVYVEKPMAHSIEEVRAMAAAAKKYKVVTQLGNQGHSSEGIRRVCEYIWAGAIGNVLETYSWAPTGRGGTGGRLPTKPVPEGLHWDEWIGPAAYRDYHDRLHPGAWRTWWEFGGGSLGDWGCHNLDGVHWALKLGAPTSVEALVQEGGSDERFPEVNVVRWEFPAREGMPPVKVHWYDGYRPNRDKSLKDEAGEPVKKILNRPAIVAELEKKYDRKLGEGGIVFIGDKGIMVAGNYSGKEGAARLLPEEKHRAFPVPEKKIPRVKGTHVADFLRACKGGAPACSDFAVSAPLTEMVLVGCLALRAGVGKKVLWDAEKMECTNLPELNRLVKRQYRPGWTL